MTNRAACFLFTAAVLACSAAPRDVASISPEALLSSPPEGVLILDVRRTDEYAAGHVPGAVNIPHDELAERLDELAAGPDTPVVVYCEKGGRADVASSLLAEAGFTSVLELDGHMSQWRSQGRPTEP